MRLVLHNISTQKHFQRFQDERKNENENENV